MNWLWPEIQDKDDAKKASQGAAGVAFFIALVTSIVTILEVTGRLKLFGFGPEAFIDAGLFLAIGIGLLFCSRIAAVVGLILYGVEQYFMMKSGVGKPSLVMIFFTLGFINGIRGSFGYHRFKKEESASSAPQAGGPQSVPAPAAPVSEAPSESGRPKTNFLFIFLGILVIGGLAALVIPQYLGNGKAHKGPKMTSVRKNTGKPLIPGLPQIKIPSFSNPFSKKEKVVAGGEDANYGLVTDGENRTFKLKTGKEVRGKVIFEDETYYTVETFGGGQEYVIKEDLATA